MSSRIHPSDDAIQEARLGGRRYHVLWDERLAQWPRTDQLRLTIPMIGWFTPPDFAFRLSEVLRERWLADRSRTGPRILAVAAHVKVTRERRCLILLITLDQSGVGARRVDDPQMARVLRQSIHQVSNDSAVLTAPGDQAAA